MVAFTRRNITISLHHGVSITVFQGLFGIQSRVNATIDHPRAALARHSANLISAESIARMYADADDISWHDAFRHNLLQRLIDENGISRCLRCRRRKNKQPRGKARVTGQSRSTLATIAAVPSFHG